MKNIIKFGEQQSINERGFFSVVLQAISIYIKYPNIPFYIDLSEWKLFQDNKNENVWEYFFEQYYEDLETNYKISDINTLANYQFRFELLPHFHNNLKNKKIKKNILDIVEKNSAIFKDKNVLGVHRRVTDKVNFPGHFNPIDFDIIIKNVDAVKDNYDLIYFFSDDKKTMDFFEDRYKDKFYCYSDAFRSDDDRPIHTTDFNISNYKKAEDVLVESILFSKCNHLFTVDSNVSLFAMYLTDSKFTYLG